MWKMLTKLATILRQFGLSFDDLVEIIKALTTIPKPPAIQDEEDFKSWVKEVMEVASDIAKKTPTQSDDTVLQYAYKALMSDAIWPSLYALLKVTFAKREVAAPGVVTGEIGQTIDEFQAAQELIQAAALADKTTDDSRIAYGSIDPGSIVAVAMAIYEIYKFLTD